MYVCEKGKLSSLVRAVNATLVCRTTYDLWECWHILVLAPTCLQCSTRKKMRRVAVIICLPVSKFFLNVYPETNLNTFFVLKRYSIIRRSRINFTSDNRIYESNDIKKKTKPFANKLKGLVSFFLKIPTQSEEST